MERKIKNFMHIHDKYQIILSKLSIVKNDLSKDAKIFEKNSIVFENNESNENSDVGVVNNISQCKTERVLNLDKDSSRLENHNPTSTNDIAKLQHILDEKLRELCELKSIISKQEKDMVDLSEFGRFEIESMMEYTKELEVKFSLIILFLS